MPEETPQMGLLINCCPRRSRANVTKRPTFLSLACALSQAAQAISAAIISFCNNLRTSSSSLCRQMRRPLASARRHFANKKERQNSPVTSWEASPPPSSWWSPSRSVLVGSPSSLAAWCAHLVSMAHEERTQTAVMHLPNDTPLFCGL